MKILIIEDDITLSRLLALRLREEGYQAISAGNGEEGIRLVQEQHPDLVVLDIMMADMDGWEVSRRLRAFSDVPIIVLTAKSLPTDIVQGFQLGADDYVTKPFNIQELLLRIGAVLRRADGPSTSAAAVYRDDTLQIDLDRRLVQRRGMLVHLTPTEFRLLDHLVRHRDRVLSHADLLSAAWGAEYAQETAVLSVYVRYLREKLEENPSQPQYIVTEWRVGYRFASRERKP